MVHTNGLRQKSQIASHQHGTPVSSTQAIHILDTQLSSEDDGIQVRGSCFPEWFQLSHLEDPMQDGPYERQTMEHC